MFEKTLENNPWNNIESIYEFQYFNCPSCSFKNKLKTLFIQHAYFTHPESTLTLQDIKDGSLDDISCLPWNYLENTNQRNDINSKTTTTNVKEFGLKKMEIAVLVPENNNKKISSSKKRRKNQFDNDNDISEDNIGKFAAVVQENIHHPESKKPRRVESNDNFSDLPAIVVPTILQTNSPADFFAEVRRNQKSLNESKNDNLDLDNCRLLKETTDSGTTVHEVEKVIFEVHEEEKNLLKVDKEDEIDNKSNTISDQIESGGDRDLVDTEFFQLEETTQAKQKQITNTTDTFEEDLDMEVDASDIATPLKSFIKPIYESREIVELANQYKYLIGSQAEQSNRLNLLNNSQLVDCSKEKLKIFVQEKNKRNKQYNSLIKNADLVTKNIKANIAISETFAKTEAGYADVHEGPKIFECQFCHSIFSRPQGLIKHTENCAMKAKLDLNVSDVNECKFCHSVFPTSQGLIKHTENCAIKAKLEPKVKIPDDQKIKSEICQFCNSIFSTANGLIKHTENCAMKAKLDPISTNGVELTAADLNRHLKKVHEGQNINIKYISDITNNDKISDVQRGRKSKNHECNFCHLVSFPTKEDLKSHINNVCTAAEINRHTKIVHEGQNINLKLISNNDKIADNHEGEKNTIVKKWEDIECPYCGKILLKGFSKHQSKCLGILASTKMSGLYFCYICGANSKSHFGLKSHMEIIHSNQHPIFVRKNPTNNKLINYSCERCKTVFRGHRSHDNFFAHMTEVHGGYKKFNSEDDDHDEKSEPNVQENNSADPSNVHEGIESDVDKVETEIQPDNTKSNMKKVLLTVHEEGQKTYNCVDCGKCFEKLEGIKHHITTTIHTTTEAENDYMCNICFVISSSFQTSKERYNHLSVFHPSRQLQPSSVDNYFIKVKANPNNIVHEEGNKKKTSVEIMIPVSENSSKYGEKHEMEVPPINNVYEEQKDYQCSMCGRIFSSFKARNKHLRKLHFSAPALECDNNLEKCPYCKKTVSSYAGHLAGCHTRSLEVYHAEQRDFPDHPVHLKHMEEKSLEIIHEGQKVKDYKCFMCATIFSTFNGRRKHLQDVHFSVDNMRTMEYNLKSALEVPDEDLKQCPYCKETVSSYARHLKDCHARILKIYQYQGQQKDDGQKLDQILIKVNGGQKVSSNSAHEEQNILPKNLQEVAEVVHEGIEQLPNPVHEGQKETEIEKNDDVVSINLDAEVTSNSNEMYAIVKERGQSTRLQDYDLDIFKKTGKYKCLQCTEVYMAYKSLEGHLNDKHGGKKFKCDECGVTFNRFYILKDHRIKVHNMAMFSKYQFEGPCKICGKEFKNEQFLRKHIQSKHENLQVQCDSCGKIFTTQLGLKTHTKTVHEGRERNHCCEKCGKSFYDNGRLKMHFENVHEGLKRYKCPHCEKACSQSGDLKRHIRRFHKEES